MNRTRKHKAVSQDIVRRVDMLWSDGAERRRICEALATYGVESYEQEPDRVRLAILKLSDGIEDKLLAMVAAAKQDYRDVLMWAEYPEQGSMPPTPLQRKLTEAERTHLRWVRRRDREQYEAWLTKSGK
jgi:hypothetical protein